MIPSSVFRLGAQATLALLLISIFIPLFAGAVQRSALGGVDQALGFLFGVLRGALSVDHLDPCGVYFGTTGGQVWFSADDGEAWSLQPCALSRILCVEAFVPENADDLVPHFEQ